MTMIYVLTMWKHMHIPPPFDSYINELTVHVYMDANSSSVELLAINRHGTQLASDVMH